MESLDAAVVLEFAADHDADIDAVCDLAARVPARIVAVVQEIDAARRAFLLASLSHLPNVEVRVVGAPLGRGAALRLGLRGVTERFVGIVNLDFAFEPDAIVDAFRLLESSSEIDGVVAVRSRRRWFGDLYNAFANALLNIGATDVQAPLKLFRTEPLRGVLDELQLFDHGFDADLMYRARRHRLRLTEIPARGVGRPSEWPVAAVGSRALAALLSLKLLDSRFGHHPLAMRVGRPYVLARKESYALLIFCWRDPRSPKAGGGEVYLHEQALHWVRQGHRVTWVAQAFRGAPAEETLDGIRIVRRGRGLLVFPAAALWYVFRSGWRFDFILDVMNGLPFFTPLFSSKPKACLLYHVHSHHFRDELPRPLSDLAIAVETRLVPWIYRRTRFLTISASSADEMRALGITRLPLEVIHSGVADAMRPGAKHPRPTILYLGRLRRYKGVRKLIDAFVAVKRAIPDARLVIAGSGDDEDALRTYAAEVRDVEFAGAVDDATKVRLFQEAWVFGMPSALEGWGIVVIEAASCGTPSVAFDVNGLRDCIVDGETGLLARDQAAFTSHLRTILGDAAVRERLSRAALVWSAGFSWDRTAQRTLNQIRRAQPWNVVFDPAAEVSLSPGVEPTPVALAP